MNDFLSQYKKYLILWALILVAIVIALALGIDKKILLIATVILGLFTHVFSGLGAIIAMIPWVGPLIVKVFTIPFFWLLNAMGYFVSIIAIKKGYTKEVTSSRVLTIALLVGIVVGYILGNLIPLN
ncbi:MAG: hypothetical protein GXO92_03555 [FCB group bacterium]|nr:hypothetical protein [FCB group bacterium]